MKKLKYLLNIIYLDNTYISKRKEQDGLIIEVRTIGQSNESESRCELWREDMFVEWSNAVVIHMRNIICSQKWEMELVPNKYKIKKSFAVYFVKDPKNKTRGFWGKKYWLCSSYPVQCKIVSTSIECPSWNTTVPSLQTR